MPPEPQRRLTLLQIIPRLEAGGAELGALQVARRMVAEGHRAIVASQGGRMVAELEAAGAEHVVLPVASKNPVMIARNIGSIAALVRAQGVDLLHARSRSCAWSALAAARRTGVPFVTTYHSDYSARGPAKRFYNSVMARGDAVIAVSNAIAASIGDQYPWARARTVVIHRGIDPARFDPAAIEPERVAALRRAWGVEADVPIALLAARLTARKGHAAAIRALARASGPGMARLVMVCAGDDHQRKSDYRGELERLAAQLGVADRVRFAGHVADMPAAYAAASISLLVSSAEGFPRVALESQAMGVPVVVTHHGPGREAVLAPPDVAPDAATGFHVPYDDPDAIAAALRQYFTAPEEARAAMQRRGIAWIAGRFTIDRLTAATLALYLRLATERGPARPA